MSDPTLLLDKLLDVPRHQSAVSAVRERTADGWRHHTWQELQVAVRRAAGAVPARGSSLRWTAARGADQLIADLAMQFGGVIGELSSDGEPVGTGNDDAGRLVRLRQEMRARDPAVWFDGRVIDQGEVAVRAERACRRLAPRPGLVPEVVLCTVDARTDQLLGWASVWGGLTLVCGAADDRENTDPSVWVCTASQWADAKLTARSPMERLRHTGSRLRRVFVVGAVSGAPPPPPGVEIGTWTL